jgi:hypothetical protein
MSISSLAHGDSPGDAPDDANKLFLVDGQHVHSSGDSAVRKRVRLLRILDRKCRPQFALVDRTTRNAAVVHLLELSEALDLPDETRFLAIRILDDALSVRSERDVLLLAAASLLLSAKMSDTKRPGLGAALIEHSPDLQIEQITDEEVTIFQELGFDLYLPTPWQFLRCLLEPCQAEQRIDDIARTARLSCLVAAKSCESWRFTSEELATSAITVARELVANSYQLDKLQEPIGDCAALLIRGLRDIGQSQLLGAMAIQKCQ